MSPRPAVLSVAVGIALGLCVGLSTTAAAAAVGAPGVPLADPGKVTGVLADRAGVLGDQADDVTAALERLGADTALDLTVVLVDDFGDWDPRDWADASAVASSLRTNDGLLAIAVDDARYAFSLDEKFPVADDTLADIDAQVADLVAAHDWADAATTAADGYRTAWLDAAARTGRGRDHAQDADGPAPFPWLPAAIGAVVLLAAGVLLARRSASRRTADGEPPASPEDLPAAELAATAARGLVAVDDALAASAAELAAAQAHLGGATDRFAEALDAARDSLAEAFALHRRAELTHDAAARRTLLLGVVERCEEVDRALDARSAGLGSLRALEASSTEALDAVGERLRTLAGRLPACRTTAAALADVVPLVADNPDAARVLLSAAGQNVATARAATDDRTTAARLTRSAEAGVARAAALLDAVDAAAALTEDPPADVRAAVLHRASATVAAAVAVVGAHRPAVGAEARTHLAAAARLLAAAHAARAADAAVAQVTDAAADAPADTEADARQAEEEARAALRAAQGDVERARITYPPGATSPGSSGAVGTRGAMAGWGGSGGAWRQGRARRGATMHSPAEDRAGTVRDG